MSTIPTKRDVVRGIVVITAVLLGAFVLNVATIFTRLVVLGALATIVNIVLVSIIIVSIVILPFKVGQWLKHRKSSFQ